MGLVSLILGITSFILCLIPLVGVVAIIPIIIAIILGIVHLVKLTKNPDIKESKGPAVAGISLSISGLVIMIAWLVLVWLGISYFNSYEDEFTNMIDSTNEIPIEEQNKEINQYKDILRENMK